MRVHSENSTSKATTYANNAMKRRYIRIKGSVVQTPYDINILWLYGNYRDAIMMDVDQSSRSQFGIEKLNQACQAHRKCP
jgi:hypothetical protein